MAVPGDNPIRRREDHLLGRSRQASALVRQVLVSDASEGLVVGVLGPWGSGKTSFVNLTRASFDENGITVLDFNPWMFSGAEQLVDSFFIELASQLRLRPDLAEIGEDLEDYGETFSGLAWLPLVGPWVERGRAASKLIAKILQRRKEGVGGRRQKLAAALRALDRPLVVVLDDIDRLTTSEIQDIFKLIRLTANFPNIIYLAAFDRNRVEGALSENGIPGREYLEKILQVGVDLPAVPDSVLHNQVFKALGDAIVGVEPEAPFEEAAWPDVYMEVIRPLLRNMRDVRRYAAAVHGTVIDLGGQIELVDVLAMEAIRVFLPNAFSLLPRSVDGLTTTSSIAYGAHSEPPHLRDEVEKLIASAKEQGHVVKAMIERLFPAARRHVGGNHFYADSRHWLRDRRVAHEHVLRLYLERVVGEGLQAFIDAESAWAVMTDREELEVLLRSLDRERLQDVIGSLEVYERQFTQAHVVPTITVLLNLLPEMPKRGRAMFDFGPRMAISRVTYRLLRALPDESAVESIAQTILPELSMLSAKLLLIEDVGYREGRGHKLVSEGAAIELERNWRAEVRGTSVDRLVGEPDLLRTLYVALKEVEPGEGVPSIEVDPRLTAAILTSSQNETRSNAFGSRAVRRTPSLSWDVLVEIYGDESVLQQRVNELKRSDVEIEEGLLALAEKYVRGWRPEQFDEEPGE